MITIEEAKLCLANTLECVAEMRAEGYQAFGSDLRTVDILNLAISQNEEIERLKQEAKEWKAFYFEALDKLNNAYERAAQEADQGDDPTFIANRIRALKTGEPK